MRRVLPALLLVFFSTHASAATLTFEAALERALEARGVHTAFASGIARLETPTGPMLPTIRAEASAQRAENIELFSGGAVRFDALTVLLAVDYPLFGRAPRERRLAVARTSAQLFRRSALDEADEVFRETLDAFSDLYVAQRRLEHLGEGVRHAAALRERARKMLDLGQITVAEAAAWEEQALATESQRLDLELARLDAETRVKQLIEDTSNETILALLDLDGPPRNVIRTVSLDRATLHEEQKKLAVEELSDLRRPQVLLSGFGGIASVPSSFRGSADDGTYGIYGLRISFNLPSLDDAAVTRLAVAQLELEEATRRKRAATAATRTRGNLLSLSRNAAGERIAILEQHIELARRRQESMTRLVGAGVRTESELFEAIREVARRESDLDALRVERWRLEQLALLDGAQP